MRFSGFVVFTISIVSDDLSPSVRNFLNKHHFYADNNCLSSTDLKAIHYLTCSANSVSEATEKMKLAFNLYCTENKVQYKDIIAVNAHNDELMNTYNAHNGDLVDKINYIWQCEKYDRSLKTIATALYERDIEECNDKNIFIEEYKNDLYGFLYEMFMHVCDDADLEVVINFVRARNSKGQTIWADSDSWEE